VSLAELAEREGLKPRLTIADWLNAHPGMSDEIRDVRAKGFKWKDVVMLLRKHYDYPWSDDDRLREALAEQ